MLLYDAFDAIDTQKVVSYVSKLQNDDGSFQGDEWGEIDTRFSFCAVATLAILVSGFKHKIFLIDMSIIFASIQTPFCSNTS